MDELSLAEKLEKIKSPKLQNQREVRGAFSVYPQS